MPAERCPVGGGGQAEGFGEVEPERSGGGEASLLGDGVDGETGALEQSPGAVQSLLVEPLDEGTLSPDIRAEQDKLDRAGLVVLQFPLWWFGMPAILKGWIDRVFIKGYAYSIPDPERPGRSLRYGTGGLAGKRALAVVTVGADPDGYGSRGIDGALEDVLFPLLHGTFFYTGMSPLPPVAIYNANHLSGREYQAAAAELRTRLRDAQCTKPIPYRTQDSGDYDGRMVLRPHVAPGRTGLAAHLQ